MQCPTQLDVYYKHKDGYSNYSEETALHQAALHGSVDGVTLLIQHAADVNAQTWRSKHAPLHYTAKYNHPAVVKILLEAGSQVNQKPNTSSLMMAACVGDIESVRLLISYGSDLHATDKQQYTALHWAVFNNEPDVVDILIKNGANYEGTGSDGNRLLHSAVKLKTANIAEMLIKGTRGGKSRRPEVVAVILNYCGTC